MLSESEIIAILKKSLPKSDSKSLESAAHSIVKEGAHWQEADLDEHIHDELESQVLHKICERQSQKKPGWIKLFFKNEAKDNS